MAKKRIKPGPPKGRPRDDGRNPAVLALLQKKGLTQEALARKVGATPSSISHVFHGRKGLSLTRATALAKALGVKVERLMEALSGV